MPWEVRKQDEKYCVYKIGGSEALHCYDNEADAVKYVRALYANEPSHMKYSVIAYSDDVLQETDDPNVKWVQAWRYSTWEHPKYGTVSITPSTAADFKSHFDSRTLGRDHLVNYDHGQDAAKGGKSAGLILDIEPRDDGVWYKVQFTENALNEIKSGEWRYLSPEYDDYYIDPETGNTFENMPFDLALTNTPFFKGMAPLNFSEFEHKDFVDWSTAYKNNLPDSAFLFVEAGADKDKSKRHLPVKDASGKVDLNHLRNAISRLSQKATGTGEDGWLTEALRERLLSKARTMLANATNSPKGGSEVDELLKKFAERLGVTFAEDATEEAILGEADRIVETLQPLRDMREESDRQRTFREAFPEEYKRMKKLEQERIGTESRSFAEGYARFTVRDGVNEYKSVMGFSQVVQDKIAEVHKKFSERSATTRDLKELLDLIGDKGIVDYSEKGSSRTAEHREFNENPKLAFNEAIQDVMASDNLEYEAAMRVAAQKYPKLFEEYMASAPRV